VGKIEIERQHMKRLVITATVTKVRVPLKVLIPMKIGIALIRLGALIAGVTYEQE
jgi:hypothetical protein